MRAETYIGNPCPKGHTLRYRKAGQCVECTRNLPKKSKEQRAAYQRQYRTTRKRLGNPVD